MTALKQQWRQQRQQRQHDLAERQQQVRETLSAFRETRSEKAAQLRDDLSLFQLELQQDVSQFLSDTSEQRQAQAAQLMQMLNRFTADLQTQTAQFLALTSADRVLMAQQLNHDLSAFHQNLMQSVAELREALQIRMQTVRTDVQALRTETQILMALQHEERLQRKEETAQALSAFIDALQVNVHSYLSQLETLRNERAAAVHDMLQSDREQRSAEMDDLFLQLGAFRAELKGFCTELRSTVWGNGSASEPVKPASAPVAKSLRERSKTAAKGMAKAQIKAISKPAATAKPAIAPIKAAIPVTRVEPVVLVSKLESPKLDALTISEISLPTTVRSEPTQSGPQDAGQIEKAVFEHIQTVHGARLTEIEAALGINRFQAVDALRSLIKKGGVTQRDRIYLAQEDISL